MLFSDIIEITELTLPRNSLTCSGTSCSGVLTDGTPVGYSLDNFGGIHDVGSGDLAGFNDQYSAVMIHEGVTLVQGRSAGRFDGRRYEFLNYAGWLANSAFAFQWELATLQGSSVDTISWLTTYSFGVATGTNPSGSGKATYLGAMVGLDAYGATIVQGRANLVVNLDASNINVTLSQIKNLETGNDVANMVWSEIPLSGGTFESTTNESSIEGNFYGDRHEEVGGIFDRDNILGAFGATRQP